MSGQEAINNREWSDPTNWAGWFNSYSSKADDRVWVPKRDSRTGLTLNFAHSAAWWSLLGLSIVPVGFVLLVFLLWLDRTT